MTFRNAQGYFLGEVNAATTAAGATSTITATAQIDLMLENLMASYESADSTQITSIKVAGQELFCSNQSAPAFAFSNTTQGPGGFRSISCPMAQNQTLQVGFSNTGTVAARYGFAAGTTPITANQVIPTSQLGQALNYVAGMGQVSILNAGGTGTLSCTILRPCLLGRLVLAQDLVAPATFDQNSQMRNVQIDSIKVNNIELLSGSSTSSVPGVAFASGSTLGSDLLASYPAELNSTVTITITNNIGGVGNTSFGGAIFCLPILI